MSRHRLAAGSTLNPVTLAVAETTERTRRPGSHRAASPRARSLPVRTATFAAITGAIALGSATAGQAAAAPSPAANLDIQQEFNKLFGGILPPTAPGHARAVKPASGTVTSNFGARWGTNHNGMDIANRIGTPIYAVTDGVVIESGPASGYGLWVRVRQDDGTTGIFGHVDQFFVQKGQRVRAGQQIATMGNRGYSTGPHLHYEIWNTAGNPINPQTWLNNRGVRI